MKRSDAIEIIRRVLADSTSWPSDESVAKAILTAIEKAGMLPPQQPDWPSETEERIEGEYEWDYEK